jgi:DNA-binding NtrC family response regulator
MEASVPTTPEMLLGTPAIICSQLARELMDLVQRVAQTNAAVLITGETGSGKELIARAIHHYSLRCTKPWVDVNCAALPDHLIESELFGHEKGAFSGADHAKPGLFELAHTGTLFLDEIGELDPKLQVKLLRVLDGVPYYRLGGVKKISADVRIVAATNQDLRAGVRGGRFRSDLYHRLSQMHLNVPPLRERRDDIGPLAEFFLQQQDASRQFTRAALQALRQYAWPGNVRELKNAVIKSAILSREPEIDARDLPQEIRNPELAAEGEAPAHRLDQMEREAILLALEQVGGHHQRAADLLGISRRTLIRKLKLYRTQGSFEDSDLVGVGADGMEAE